MPIKKSKNWIWILILYTIIIFTSFLITRVILGSEVIGRYLIGILIISLGSAFLPCIGGYLGKRIFFIIASLSIMTGILYMFYVVIGDISPGWGDLTSLIGYLFIDVIGTALALIIEVVSFYVLRNKIE